MSAPTEALSAATAIVAATNLDTAEAQWLKEAITVLKESNLSERSEMQRLNKELKGYLESVRILENCNSQLIGDVDHARKSAMPTVVDKSELNKELEFIRKRLEEESLDATSLQIRIEKSEFDKEQLVSKMRFYQNEAESQRNAIQQLVSQLADHNKQREILQRSANLTENDIKKYKESITKAEGELERLSGQLKNSRYTNKKLEFEIQTLSDELSFNKALFDEEINDLRTRTNGANVFSALDLTTFYKNELNTSITQIRRDFETLNETQIRDLKVRKEAELQLAVKQAEFEKAQALELKNKNEASYELEIKGTSELRSELDSEQKQLVQLKERQKQQMARLAQLERMFQDSKQRNHDEYNDKAAMAERLKRENKEKLEELDLWYTFTRNKYETEIQIYRSILNSQLKLNQDASIITVHNPPRNPNTRPVTGNSTVIQGGQAGNGGSAGVIISGATGGAGGNKPTEGSSAAHTIITSGTNPSGVSVTVSGSASTGANVVITSSTSHEWSTQMVTTTGKPRDQSISILRQVFETFDSNKNGSINSREFDRILGALNVQLTAQAYDQILREADRDGNREINFDEFCRIMSPVLTGKFNDDELWYAFKKFDLDNSGEITVEELSQILSKVGQFYSDQQIADMIKTVDRDNNGKLNFQEFCRLMKTSM